MKPEPQEYLEKEARKIYWEIIDLLEGVDALEEIDSYGLSIMAMDLWLFKRAAQEVSEKGGVQITPNGYSQITGYFTVMEKCKASFLKYSEKYGLSPKDRQLILKFKNKKEEKDALDELLS